MEAPDIRPAGTILCVDNEPNILAALRRLFRAKGYEVVTAESGRAGLEVLEARPVDLIIFDMRMPEMDGVQFLERARAVWPDTLRLLLTGYAEVNQILDAVNRGEIYRYITKPWDDHEITLVVRHALERKALEHEQRRLEALTVQQNEQLRELNQSLEAKVAARTEELVGSNDKLKRNFLTGIQVFSSLIELRGAHLAGHSRRVADLARRIALRLGLEGRETQQIFIAGLLHNIGKIGFSDSLLEMAVPRMNGELLGLYRSYPARGEQLLMPLEDLREAATLVRAHQERFDGEGFPDRLAGLDIPIGARILALASGYDNLQAFSDPEQALLRCAQASFNIVMSAYRMPGLTGADFLQMVKGLQPDAVRLMLSASTEFTEVSNAINRAEVFRYVAKRWDGEELQKIFLQAFARRDDMLRARPKTGLSAQEIEVRRLESEEPGITQVRRDAHGAVYLD